MRPHPILLGSLLALVFAGCGGDDETSSPGASGSGGTGGTHATGGSGGADAGPDSGDASVPDDGSPPEDASPEDSEPPFDAGNYIPYQPPCGNTASTKTIGNWDVVPGQVFENTFEVGVVAFHEYGVDVSFTVNGEPASDPQAMEKIAALSFNTGAWSGDVTIAMSGCWDDLIENCIGNTDYVVAVSSYAGELESAVSQGVCYHEEVTEQDVVDYVRRMTPLFSMESEILLEQAAREAFVHAAKGVASADFQAVALEVLDAIDGKMSVRLQCPGSQLESYYGGQCPP